MRWRAARVACTRSGINNPQWLRPPGYSPYVNCEIMPVASMLLCATLAVSCDIVVDDRQLDARLLPAFNFRWGNHRSWLFAL